MLQKIQHIQTVKQRHRKKKSAKIKCHLFRPKLQKFNNTEITGYTVYIYIVLPKIVEKLKHYKSRLFRNRTKAPLDISPPDKKPPILKLLYKLITFVLY